MDRTGLILKFKVNRELTKLEKYDHMPVGKESSATPASVMSTIRMNSTYLEWCDKFYFSRGEITAFGIFVLVSCVGMLSLPVIEIFQWSSIPEYKRGELIFATIIVFVAGIPVTLAWFILIRKEIFRYTHYPIRFNRKTRMVHFFRLDGTVMSESWDKLYVTLGKGKEYGDREVHCHRLSEDGNTVLETHALPYLAFTDRPRSQWEFVRRYMEIGPAEVLPYIDHVLDGHIGQPGKREGFWHGYEMYSTNTGAFIFYIVFPISFCCIIGRWICMRTCKQPVWPAEIEAESAIDPDDPYLVDKDHLPEGVEA